VHEFGAILLGVPVPCEDEQKIEGDCEVSGEAPAPAAPAPAETEEQKIEGDREVSDETPAPAAPAPAAPAPAAPEEQPQVEDREHVSEMWLRVEDNLRAAAFSGDHSNLVGKVDQILVQIKGVGVDKVIYPPSMFGWGCGRFPMTVDELKEDRAACRRCQLRTTSGNYYCGMHKFAAAVIGAPVAWP
jgi:hypothetical protein